MVVQRVESELDHQARALPGYGIVLNVNGRRDGHDIQDP